MRIDSSFNFNHKNYLIKLLLTVFFSVLAFRLLFFHSLPPPIDEPFPNKIMEPQNEQVIQNEKDKVSPTDTGKCDYFDGDWVRNPLGPMYTNETCDLIESHQNCMKNGRPDREFLYWKWAPRDCELPVFDPKRFLEMMRGKIWALIGDSISRNHVQSLLCMLSKVEKAVLVYHDEEYKSKSWNFPSYNLTISVLWSPFLAEAAIFEDINGVSSSDVQLHVDKLDSKWTDQYLNFDYIIISTGKWYVKSAIYYENNTVLGCHWCTNNKNYTEVGFDTAYRKVLKNVMDFISSSYHKGLILFRTSTPDHFENGEWFSGGTCNRTVPIKEAQVEIKNLLRIIRDIELEEFEKAAPKALKNGVNLKLLDVAPLSLLRPDGHPGPYRQFQPFAKNQNAKVQTDCLHWCLPGPIDSWNDIIMEMVVSG
ncbi:protein trichome birefringence-like 24 [Vicia villosa]|uniref:protein trichome birefringence-like 24 n=1 Tax=Vicia villosa TaxID=3911 RepID=UPI00273AF433|nr:protein trichome birefringence-like 24 [Vicia villosa]